MYFRYFSIITRWKTMYPFVWTECFVPRLVVIGAVILEKNILNVNNVFHHLAIISHW